MNKRGFIESDPYGENNPEVGKGEKPRHQTKPEKENTMRPDLSHLTQEGVQAAIDRERSAMGQISAMGSIAAKPICNRLESTTKSVQDLIGRVEELRGTVGPIADRLLGEEIANTGESVQIYGGGGQIDTLDGAISELRDGLRRLCKQIDRLNVL